MKVDERERAIEKLNIDISLMCLKVNFLERRIQGIKTLCDTLKMSKFGNKQTTEEGQWMLEWMRKNKIMNLIFDTKTYHVQIVQRSKEVIKFLLGQGAFDEGDLDLVWKATFFDDEAKKEIYKIIKEVGIVMGPEQTKNFLTKFKENTKGIIPGQVECVYEFVRHSNQDEEIIDQATGLLWSYITDDSLVMDVVQMACMKFIDVLKSWSYEKAEPYFNKILDNFKEQKSSIVTIKLFKQMLKSVDYIQYEKYVLADGETPEDIENPPKQTVINNCYNCSDCIMYYID